VGVVGGRAEWLGKLATLGADWCDEQAQIVSAIAAARPAIAAAGPFMSRCDVTAVLLAQLLSRLFAARPVVRNRA